MQIQVRKGKKEQWRIKKKKKKTTKANQGGFNPKTQEVGKSVPVTQVSPALSLSFEI